ncbi:MAG: hypothetical protein PHY99_07245, partial [Bacteroidales bacterium]|nr:hypothetical protein [Bacteroidales bacterium]
GELFELSAPPSCDTLGQDQYRTFENDLFGVEPVRLMEYNQNIHRMISWIRPDDYSSSELDCIRKKEVKLPELRDRFLKIASDPEASGQVLLVLMKMK